MARTSRRPRPRIKPPSAVLLDPGKQRLLPAFYQLYPSSYQDSDGNGIGDIAGIQPRLGYLDSLGVNALWLNPVFKSGLGDGGYDVIDFYQVDPRFGTNAGLAAFAKDAHRRGMRVVLDLVAGHTSNQSE